MTSINPIVEMIQALNLPVKDFCILFNCSLNSMRLTTSGHIDRVPKCVKEALTQAGFDVTDIDAKYKQWQLKTAELRRGNNVH